MNTCATILTLLALRGLPSRKRVCGECGLAFIEIAIIVPILISVVLAAGFLYNYIRVYQTVKFAAETAAAIASSAEVKSSSDPNSSYLLWSHVLGGSKPYRPVPFIGRDFCRGLTDQLDLVSCYGEATGEGRLSGFVWNNYATSADSPLSSSHALPFALYSESATTPGYSPVQVLPIIGIERSCREPMNETGNTMSSAGRRLALPNTSPSAIRCTHVRPMYWQSPMMADFDGDRKEDIVLFKPQGTSTTWGAHGSLADMDFIVYYSGAGFSGTAGHGYFNLASDTSLGTPGVTPNVIPIVADYDRDGLSDYATFDARSGNYYIAFSASNYRVIGSGNMGISDANGNYGLFAIPGTYTQSDRVQVAVVQTAAASSSQRYDIYLTAVIAPTTADLNGSNGTLITLPNGRNISGNEVPSADIYKLKPQPGTSAVPAFADYDDDGITEIGYLQWYGGNYARQVAGATTSLRTPGNTSVFETDRAQDRAPIAVRMNPFAMAFDSYGNLFYTDSVDGRIWRIDAGNLEGPGTGTAGSTSPIMPEHSFQSARPEGVNPQLFFPKENIYNLPRDTRTLAEAVGTDGVQTKAANRSLRTPRKIAIASSYDGAMYVADFGNARILRVEDGGSGITSQSNSRLVLGSNNCIGDGCTALKDTQNSTDYDTWEANSGRYQIWPSAVAIVPDRTTAGKYFLAFSTHNAVYLITHGNATGGPKGEAGDKIWKILGGQTPAYALSMDQNSSFVSTMVPSNSRKGSFCPVIDMQYSSYENNGALLLAHSCSLIRKPREAVPTNQAAGGIIKLAPALGASGYYFFHDPNAENLTNQVSLAVGGQWEKPCLRTDGCSTPSAGGAGLYERRVDVSNTLPATIDLINPSSIALGGYGELFITEQWNEGEISSSTYYPNSPQLRSQTHTQGVYRWGGPRAPRMLNALTNSFFYGGGIIPVQGPDWYSPYTNSSDADNVPIPYILSQQAPVKNVPVPAAAGLAIYSGRLYTSTPFVQDSTGISSTHPYHVIPQQVGFIYSIDLDQDGDGTYDSADSDIDGDGVGNNAETFPRDPYCPEITGSASTACRPQERVGLPRLTFAKLLGGTLQLRGEGSATETTAMPNATYGEFLLFNSVAECGNAAMCSPSVTYNGGSVRPEVWATLFNFGEDQDLSATDACSSNNNADSNSPYANCINTSNGPIAIPQALHAFTGWHSPTGSYTLSGYPGYHFREHTTPGVNRRPDPNLFLFPAILSSTRPRENGIKPTRWVPLDTTKSPRIQRSGILCRDYASPIYSSGSQAVSASPFRLNFGNYMRNYFYESFTSAWDALNDNDNFNYKVDCSTADGTAFASPDSRVPGVEAVVLQLDHDDISEKEASSPQTATHWPKDYITGSQQDPENSRVFLMIDHDGNGVRDSSFLLPGAATGSSAFSSSPMKNPTMLIGFGLQNSSDPQDPSTINYIDKFREPFSDSTFPEDHGWSSDSQFTPPYLRLDAGYDGNANFTFDGGRQDGSIQRDNAFFLGLDFEPYLTRKMLAGNRQDIGAGMFTNYTRSNRFRKNAGKFPPAILAAQNVIRMSFLTPNSGFVADGVALQQGQAYVGFLKDGASCGSNLSSTATLACDTVRVMYATSYLGNTVTITVDQPLNQGYLGNYGEECDPDAALASFGCS